jgi:hypothetical protein
MVGKNSVIGRLAVSNIIDTLTDDDFFNVVYVSKHSVSVKCEETWPIMLALLLYLDLFYIPIAFTS